MRTRCTELTVSANDFSFAHGLFYEVYLHDLLTGLRVLRWNALKDWKPKSEGFDIEVELNSFVSHQGYKIVEVGISYRSL